LVKTVVTFVESGEGDGRKVDRPAAIADLFERDRFADERLAEKEMVAAPPYTGAVVDPFSSTVAAP
jgi:hypothetical protein